MPYRLLRAAVLGPSLDRISKDFLLANIALAVLSKQSKEVSHGYVPIHFRDRYGGEPSVGPGKFGVKAAEWHRQLRALLDAEKPSRPLVP